MDVVDPLLGHEEAVHGLWRAAAVRRLPHALTFEGPPGIGKYAAAVRLANGLFCADGPGPPCGTCPPCKRLRSGGRRGNHPDLYLIDPWAEAGEASKGAVTVQIKLGRIASREGSEDSAEEFLSLVSVEGGWRIVLVRDAELMNPSAQNALLKTLEEPGPSTLLVLVTAQPDALLATIRSRCVRVRFGSLSTGDAARALAGCEIDPERATTLARWAGGAPGEALRLAREGAVETRELLERALDGGVDPLEAASELWDLPGEFVGSTPTAQARLRARSTLDLFLAVLSDVRRAAQGVDAAALAHGDLAGPLAGSMGDVRARWTLDRVLELRAAMDANVTAEVIVERAFLVLAGSQGLIARA